MALSQQERRRKRERKAKSKRKRSRRNGFAAPLPWDFKMSEVMRHLIEPLSEDYVKSPEELEHLIALATAAWNTAVLPAEKQDAKFDEVARTTYGDDSESIAVLRWFFDFIAERKQRFYPHMRHTISDVSFRRQNDGAVYFEVVWSPRLPGNGSSGAAARAVRRPAGEPPSRDQFVRALRPLKTPLLKRVWLTVRSFFLLPLRIALLLVVVVALIVWEASGRVMRAANPQTAR